MIENGQIRKSNLKEEKEEKTSYRKYDLFEFLWNVFEKILWGNTLYAIVTPFHTWDIQWAMVLKIKFWGSTSAWMYMGSHLLYIF